MVPRFVGLSVVEFEELYAEYSRIARENGFVPQSRALVLAEGTMEIL